MRDFIRFAPEGSLWICTACGKWAKDRVEGPRGWDVSCCINSVLVKEEDIVWNENKTEILEIKDFKSLEEVSEESDSSSHQ
jgi:hypothetical protein